MMTLTVITPLGKVLEARVAKVFLPGGREFFLQKMQ